jgi:signal peptide peptidase SppA
VNVVESTAAPRALPLTLDGIGTITVDGVVGRKVDSMTRSSGVLDIMDVTEQARQFAVADEVKGVLLAIDSPGGTVTGVPEAAYALRQLSGAKPLVAYTDGLAASAGYWLASQADAIYAEASAQVGSIGVYQFLLDTSRQAELAGIKPMLFASGKYKGMGIEGLPLTPEQAQRIKDTVDIVFTWFKRDVALKRAVSDEDKQGQTFYAAEALTKNLIDRVGTRADALAELRAMIGTERK